MTVASDYDVALEAARVASHTPEFQAIVQEVAAEVRKEAAKSSRTGAFAASIQTARSRYRGVLDGVVYSDHPAARAIEYGHRAPDGSFVPGVAAFQKVAARRNKTRKGRG